MSVLDIKIKQQFDPTGENGGYRCDLHAGDGGSATTKSSLAAAALEGQEELVRGVIDSIVSVDKLFELLPFDPIEGSKLRYTRKDVPFVASGEIEYNDKLIQDKPEYARSFDLELNTGKREISIVVDANGGKVTGQDVYSFLKHQWKECDYLIPHPFPMLAITAEQFEMESEWEITNPEAMCDCAILNNGGYDYRSVVQLGSFTERMTDLAYPRVPTFTEVDLPESLDVGGESPRGFVTETWDLDGAKAHSDIWTHVDTVDNGDGTMTTTTFSIGPEGKRYATLEDIEAAPFDKEGWGG